MLNSVKKTKIKAILPYVISIFTFISANCSVSAESFIVLKTDSINPIESKLSYPAGMSMIISEIIDSINKIPGQNAVDLQGAKEMIGGPNKKAYLEILNSQNQNSTLSPNICYKIAHKIKSDKMILISGGLDTQTPILEESLASKLGFSNYSSRKNYYNYTIKVEVIDATTNAKLWENNYSSRIQIKEYPISLNNANKNGDLFRTINQLSRTIADSIAYKLNNNTDITQINNTQQTSIKENSTQKINNQHPATTTNIDYIMQNKKEEFKNWINNHI